MSRLNLVMPRRRSTQDDAPKFSAAERPTTSAGERATRTQPPFDGYAEEVFRGPVADYVIRMEDGECVIYRIDGRSGETQPGALNVGATVETPTDAEEMAQARAIRSDKRFDPATSRGSRSGARYRMLEAPPSAADLSSSSR